MRSNNGKVTLIARPEEFFYELVTQALGKSKVQTQPETEYYLVRLLNHFVNTENLYFRDANGNIKEEPLGMMLILAQGEQSAQTQRLIFQHVGDVSLYMAGFFQDSLNQKVVDIDYYIDLGEAAYHQVAAREGADKHRGMFEELSRKFGRLVDVLAEIGDQTFPKGEKDLLRFYDQWQKTQSDRAAKVLKDAGILPVNLVGKKIQ